MNDFAKSGCYVALDRMYDNKNELYVTSKVNQITALCDAGYAENKENPLWNMQKKYIFM